ncbi:hypothetical protein LCGC14_0119120 [marine sediment metagenome]|uniref:Glycosyltransferase 2-like domain-containing protein n=1 Tax=marine sediment metagenome TaxID=412755 RepID=A0A0F9Y9G3_9ZZZZ|nr:glycosyltransferase family 2 protein [Maribacter sp.]HDZ07416.1 glycosyltransferase [Maribacter sp.]
MNKMKNKIIEGEPLVSIITVVYNGEKYLDQTIQSVLNQTYKNIEYIIVDGFSTDRTLDIIRSHESVLDYWISEPDKGLYDAMNKGIALANGELIGMINSDDWYELDAVQIIVDAFRLNNTKEIFHGNRTDILLNGNTRLKVFNQSGFKFKYYGMTYNHPSMFIKKSVYKNNQYNTNLKALSDYEFVLKIFLRSPNKFHFINKSYVNYRLDGISGQMSDRNILKEGYISRKNAGLSYFENLFSFGLRWVVRKFLTKNYA